MFEVVEGRGDGGDGRDGALEFEWIDPVCYDVDCPVILGKLAAHP